MGDVYLQTAYGDADQYENNGNPNQVIGFNLYDNQGNGGGPASMISERRPPCPSRSRARRPSSATPFTMSHA